MNDYTFESDNMDSFQDDLSMAFHPLTGRVPQPMRPRVVRTSKNWYVHNGVVDECCKKPCTLNALLSYCRMPF